MVKKAECEVLEVRFPSFLSRNSRFYGAICTLSVKDQYNDQCIHGL